MNIEVLMRECNNYFYRKKETNTFIINDNSITVGGKYITGQYIRIKGSILNDGVYKVETYANNTITVIGLINEEFEGVIYGLAIQREFEELYNKIEEFNSANKMDNKASESFNNYSVSYATGASGNPLSWKDVFKNEIETYKQAFDGERWVVEI